MNETHSRLGFSSAAEADREGGKVERRTARDASKWKRLTVSSASLFLYWKSIRQKPYRYNAGHLTDRNAGREEERRRGRKEGKQEKSD